MQGTIPYLGTFLTDLTMLDTALPDQVEVSQAAHPTTHFQTKRKPHKELSLLLLT